MKPTTRAGCIALAGYLARHPLAINVDGDTSMAQALQSIADALAGQETS